MWTCWEYNKTGSSFVFIDNFAVFVSASCYLHLLHSRQIVAGRFPGKTWENDYEFYLYFSTAGINSNLLNRSVIENVCFCGKLSTNSHLKNKFINDRIKSENIISKLILHRLLFTFFTFTIYTVLPAPNRTFRLLSCVLFCSSVKF